MPNSVSSPEVVAPTNASRLNRLRPWRFLVIGFIACVTYCITFLSISCHRDGQSQKCSAWPLLGRIFICPAFVNPVLFEFSADHLNGLIGEDGDEEVPVATVLSVMIDRAHEVLVWS
jgi:hypothetical protein